MVRRSWCPEDPIHASIKGLHQTVQTSLLLRESSGLIVRIMSNRYTNHRPGTRLPNATLHAGLGFGSIVAALLIGSPLLFPVLSSPPASASWAAFILVAAAGVYVLLAAFRDRSRVLLCTFQLAAAVVLGGAASMLELTSIAVVGLLGHAAWDLWHLVREVRYVPAWYAGACVYIDIIAAVVVLIQH